MPLKVSDTFLMSGTGGASNPAGAHLMICLAVTLDGNAIVAPVVTLHHFSDSSCVLAAGDHPFIKHDSSVSYDFARSISQSAIDENITTGIIKRQASISAAILARVQVGFVKSDETAPWIFNEARGTALTAHLKHKGHM